MRSGFLGQLTSPMMGEESKASAEKMSVNGAQSSGSRAVTGRETLLTAMHICSCWRKL